MLNDMSEKEISSLLFPERAKAGDGYLIPDFKWEEFQMCKHRSSSINYQVIKIQKEEWLNSLKLEEDKILDEDKE